MTDVVRGAINLCSGCYICVGFFGYVAFCGTTEVGGNVLTSFPQTMVVQTIKLGFVLSVAVSFPLVIFPCRTSIHSLIFRKIVKSLFQKTFARGRQTCIHVYIFGNKHRALCRPRWCRTTSPRTASTPSRSASSFSPWRLGSPYPTSSLSSAWSGQPLAAPSAYCSPHSSFSG